MSEIHLPSETRIIGVDLGLNGAIAMINSSGELLSVVDMPVYKTAVNGKKRTKLDVQSCVSLVKDLVGQGVTTLALENVHAMQAGGNASFSLGYSRAVFETLSVMFEIKSVAVIPAVWKRHFGLLKADKDASIKKAIELYPDSAQYLKCKKDHGRAEAVLIAGYILRDCHNFFPDVRQ